MVEKLVELHTLGVGRLAVKVRNLSHLKQLIDCSSQEKTEGRGEVAIGLSLCQGCFSSMDGVSGGGGGICTGVIVVFIGMTIVLLL